MIFFIMVIRDICKHIFEKDKNYKKSVLSCKMVLLGSLQLLELMYKQACIPKLLVLLHQYYGQLNIDH